MEATDDNRFGIRLAFRPLRDMFVFAGRSTRSEVWAFSLLSALANMITVTVSGPGASLMAGAKLFWGLLWGFPVIALFVRRLHDQDRSGWWALTLLSQAILIAAMSALPQSAGSRLAVSLYGGVSHPAITPLSIALAAIIFAVGFMQAVALFLLPGTTGPNRYGPIRGTWDRSWR